MAVMTATLFLISAAVGQEGQLTTDPPKGITSDEIIKKFAAKEAEFKQARDNYTFRQDVRVQTLDGKTVTGEYREVFDVTYDNQGRHLENVVFAPQNTLQFKLIDASGENVWWMNRPEFVFPHQWQQIRIRKRHLLAHERKRASREAA